MAPLVSIGLPVYNGARTLERALDDLRHQDHPNLEIIVSDNGSADASVAIARRVAEGDPRVRVSAEPINRGAIWNFNRVFELSRGEFFLWAAHDDRRHASYISRCLAPMLADADVAICHTRIAVIDKEGHTLYVDQRRLSTVDESARRRFAHAITPPEWTFPIYGLIRRQHLLRTQGMLNYYGSDLGLVAELALYGKIVQLEEPLFSYYQPPPETLANYVGRIMPRLSPSNRYRPWVPLRALLSARLWESVRRSPASLVDKALMSGDVLRHLVQTSPDDVLRMAVAAMGESRFERLRAWKRRLLRD